MSQLSPRSSVSNRFGRAAGLRVPGITVVALVGLALAGSVSCGADSPTAAPVEIFKGADVAFGNGIARTEVAVQGTDLMSVAVLLSETALDGLPTQLPPMTSQEFILPLPASGPALVFNQVAVNWQPVGHPPMNIYTVPHFDVHFYAISAQQRNAITPADPAFAAKTARQPAVDALPTGYTLDAAAIPRMGVHAGPSNAPELQGAPFASTFIYGFYDGSMIFLEPMMTHAFLLAKPDTTIKISTPAKYPQPGAYPTAYAYRYDAVTRERRIELRDFVLRQ
ncbi:MAG: DUF5602 domain-containing protein [Gemmatimonadota bacterium]|nr:DUF5602 domain-containing protein [Gemmatimonadota bacterium]